MTDEIKTRKFEFHLNGRDARVSMTLYGEQTAATYKVLRDMVSLIETGDLGISMSSQAIVDRPTEPQPQPARKRFRVINCELHPGTPRNKRNQCIKCFETRVEKMHAATRAKREAKEAAIEQEQLPPEKRTYNSESAAIKVGCSKRHFRRLVLEVLPEKKQRSDGTVYGAYEVDLIREHWLRNRSRYEIEAEQNLEKQLDEIKIEPNNN